MSLVSMWGRTVVEKSSAGPSNTWSLMEFGIFLGKESPKHHSLVRLSPQPMHSAPEPPFPTLFSRWLDCPPLLQGRGAGAEELPMCWLRSRGLSRSTQEVWRHGPTGNGFFWTDLCIYKLVVTSYKPQPHHYLHAPAPLRLISA